jgi:hypothetical protein
MEFVAVFMAIRDNAGTRGTLGNDSEAFAHAPSLHCN